MKHLIWSKSAAVHLECFQHGNLWIIINFLNLCSWLIVLKSCCVSKLLVQKVPFLTNSKHLWNVMGKHLHCNIDSCSSHCRGWSGLNTIRCDPCTQGKRGFYSLSLLQLVINRTLKGNYSILHFIKWLLFFHLCQTLMIKSVKTFQSLLIWEKNKT